MTDLAALPDADLRALADAARDELSRRVRARSDDCDARLQRGDKFADSELIYAAAARCDQCGAGLAYPKNIGGRGAWYCSDVLTGRAAPDSKHDEPYPFCFWSIKSEGQPSANGATTRPA